MTRALLPVLIVLATGPASAQLLINNAPTPQNLVQSTLLGGGVVASNVEYNGIIGAPGGQPGCGAFTANGTNLGLASGIILSTGFVNDAPGMGDMTFASSGLFTGSDPDLATLSGVVINDATVLEFDFVPTGNSIEFRFVFASEEYPEYVCALVNDAFGFFLSGPGINGPFTNNAINLAQIPGTSVPVTINTLNGGSAGDPMNGCDPFNCAAADPNWVANSAYYVDNFMGNTITYDGMTSVLTAGAQVQCGQTYHIKLAIGDGGDEIFDSAVFLEGGSFASAQPVVNASPDVNLPCSGSVDISILNVNGGTPPYTYEWTLNGTPVSTNQTITVGQGQQGTYVATVTDGCGAVVQEPVVVGAPISPPMNLTVTPDLTLPCSGSVDLEVLSLTGGTAPFTYEWTLNGAPVGNGTTITVPNTAPGTYVLTVDDNCGGSVQESVVVGAPASPPMILTLSPDVTLDCQGTADLSVINVAGGTPPFTYSWTLNGNPVGTGTTIPVDATTPGTYTVTVNDNCAGVQQGSITVTVLPPAVLAVTASPDVELPCQGSVLLEVLNVAGGVGPYTYDWTLNGTSQGNGTSLNVPAGSPGTYVVTVQDVCGGSGSATVQVSPPNLPTLTITPGGPYTVPCLGDAATLTPGVTGGDGQYSYVWTDDAGNNVGSGPSLTVPVTGDATYTLEVADNCGQQTSATVVVDAPAPLELLLPTTAVACEGGSATVTAGGAGGGGDYTFLWQPSGDITAAVTVFPEADTTLTVTVTDACGASASGAVTVVVEIPVVDITVSELGGDEFRFTAQCLPGAETFHWTFSTGAQAYGATVENTFADGDQYWATVTATTPAGCTDVDSVFMQPSAQLFFPNAFTPDGDGINDAWGPVGYALTEVTYTIFDRWGAVVFTTEELGRTWDGRFANGQPCPTGVYVYQYRAKGQRFPSTKGIGSVTLLGQDIASE
ncbi:MAG TPA: choice-of-anchor L domain-containing protein [Flavobacteriales bacterium]|nr:choice-of-anchor L domain-containing protein [Flavobacteriales bacterium]HMR27158.1 choice-of-anchor L domain-containing protein [Flavobacteriales bacterium]